MNRTIALVAFAVLFAVGPSISYGAEDLSRLAVPDEQKAAVKAIKEWLDSRAIECEVHGDILVLKKNGVIMNAIPIVSKGQLDRLWVFSKYTPKEDYKGSKELEQFAAKLSRSQTFFQVIVTEDGQFIAASNLTFYDELPARLFDAFLDKFTELLKKDILTTDALKLLK